MTRFSPSFSTLPLPLPLPPPPLLPLPLPPPLPKMLTQLIAQTSTAGQALDTLSDAIEVSQKTVESWNLVWSNTFNTQESSLWIALVKLGLILAGISVTYLAVTSGKEIIEKQSWSELV